MKHVTINYNPFRLSTTIVVDGKPVGENSALTNYQTVAFPGWQSKFFDAIRTYTNDDYSISFTAPSSECAVISKLVASLDADITIQTHTPAIIDDSTLERLDLVSELLADKKGMRISSGFDIYTDMTDDQVLPLFDPYLSRYPYVSWDYQIFSINEFPGYSDRPFFIICSDKRRSTRVKFLESDAQGCMIVISGTSSFQSKGDCFVENVDSENNISNVLFPYIDMLLMEPLLRDSLQYLTIDPESDQFSVLYLLDKIEPSPYVKLPEVIELGVDYDIEIQMLPEGSPECECTAQTSDPRVISTSSLQLTPVSVGKAMIRIYSNGDPVPIASSYVQVKKRNRIRSLNFDLPRAIRVGDSYDIDIEYEPTNADNTNEIVFFTSDKYIADVGKHGTLLGINSGVATITAMAGKILKEKTIRVIPRLKKLIWEVASTEVFENSAVTVTLKREPDDAILDDVIVSVYPSSAGVYDERSGLLQLNHPGSLTLTAQTKDGKVSESVYLDVKPRKQSKGFPIWLKIILVILGLWLLAKIFPFSTNMY